MKISYHNKSFRVLSSSSNGEVSSDFVFTYKQKGKIITSEYSGGTIIQGHLLGTVDDHGNITMTYHQVNDKGENMTGKCVSKPEILENGKIRLHESWEWTSGDHSKGESVLEEV